MQVVRLAVEIKVKVVGVAVRVVVVTRGAEMIAEMMVVEQEVLEAAADGGMAVVQERGVESPAEVMADVEDQAYPGNEDESKVVEEMVRVEISVSAGLRAVRAAKVWGETGIRMEVEEDEATVVVS